MSWLQWAGQLGDGRAISLGEVVGVNKRWELQLKVRPLHTLAQTHWPCTLTMPVHGTLNAVSASNRGDAPGVASLAG